MENPPVTANSYDPSAPQHRQDPSQKEEFFAALEKPAQTQVLFLFQLPAVKHHHVFEAEEEDRPAAI